MIHWNLISYHILGLIKVKQTTTIKILFYFKYTFTFSEIIPHGVNKDPFTTFYLHFKV